MGEGFCANKKERPTRGRYITLLSSEAGGCRWSRQEYSKSLLRFTRPPFCQLNYACMEQTGGDAPPSVAYRATVLLLNYVCVGAGDRV